MVRLRADKEQDYADSAIFQFQYGAIKRRQPDLYTHSCTDFNSNMVRLRVYFSIHFKNKTKISIPIWCD